jgi:acetyl-CoA carboxylase carboxyl transferase subunit beta
MIYSKRLVRNLRVCPDCGSHQQLTAHERIEQLFDEAHVELLDVPVCGGHGIGSSIHTDGL